MLSSELVIRFLILNFFYVYWMTLIPKKESDILVYSNCKLV